MRVVILSDVFYPYLLGGGETRYWEIAKRLVKLGDEVTVLTSALKGMPRYEEPIEGLRIYRGGWSPHPLTHRSLLPVPGYVAWVLRSTRLLEDCDILDLNTYASAIAGLALARILGKPAVVTVHDVFSTAWLDGHNLAYGALGTLSERLIAWLNMGGVFITVSGASGRKIHLQLGVEKERIHVVPNGVDLGALKGVSTRGGVTQRPKRVIYVGRLIGYKNVHHLLHVVQKLHERGLDVVLDVVGSGAERRKLELLCRELGVHERVRFHGFLERKEDVYRLISQADVLVNPSCFEGFSMVLLEALALGVPVVAYNLKAYEEFLVDNVNGLLVARGDVGGLSDAVEEVLTNAGLAKNLSTEGMKTAERFDWMQTTLRLRQVYEDVIRGFS